MAHTKKHSNNKTKRHHMKKNGGKKHKNITRRHGGNEKGLIRRGVGMIGNAILFIPKRIAMGAFVGIKTGVKGVASGVGSGIKRTVFGKQH